VTSIAPGMVDTPFFDDKPSMEALQAEDIARAVMYAVSQPPHVDVNQMLIRPTAQPLRPLRGRCELALGARAHRAHRLRRPSG
jgi:hypothetical protein